MINFSTQNIRISGYSLNNRLSNRLIVGSIILLFILALTGPATATPITNGSSLTPLSSAGSPPLPASIVSAVSEQIATKDAVDTQIKERLGTTDFQSPGS
jgi:hypothetical protein